MVSIENYFYKNYEDEIFFYLNQNHCIFFYKEMNKKSYVSIYYKNQTELRKIDLNQAYRSLAIRIRIRGLSILSHALQFGCG